MSSREQPEVHLGRPAGTMIFFWTAPLAVVAGGGVLLALGEQTLLNNWSPLTMGLTHIATLGFITMTLIGACYLLIPLQLDRRIKAPRLLYFVYATFAIGVCSLCIGLAGISVTSVFVAIGTLFPALACFFWPVIASLRGTRGQPDATPLRLAIGSLLAVATIGIWVAHGHGGMKFPGPRGLWIQAHLAIALFGWIGGIAGAAFDLFSRERVQPGAGSPQGISRWWGRLLWVGVVAPSALLAMQYLGLIEMSHADATWTATTAIAPAAVAAWGIQPWHGLRSLRNPLNQVAEPHYWRTAFCLGPIALVLSAIALIQPAPQWSIASGWVAIWGWAGLIAHAILREFSGSRFADPSDDSQPETVGRIDALAFPLHLLSIVTGVAAIATGDPTLARLTGAVLLALGGIQIHRMVRIAKAMHRTAA